jgi:DNA repair protein RadD
MPHCGFLPQRPGRHLDVLYGELAQLNRDGILRPETYSREQKREFYAGLLHLCRERGHKDGAAAHRFKDRFGHWPHEQVAPQPPTAEVIAWDRHCRIRYAKRMQKAASSA